MQKLIVPILIALTAGYAMAETPASAPANEEASFSFVPRTSQDKTRVSSPSRGSKQPAVFICCSDYCEQTTREQPTILWYVSETTTDDFEIVVRPADNDHADDLLHLKMHGCSAGFQRLDLSQNKVSLQPGVQYEIMVDLIADTHHREKDSVARARIERIKPPADLSELLSRRPGKLERADVYRRRQIWYDALAMLSDEITDRETAKADTASLHRKRSELFRSCNLPELANVEMRAANG